MNVKLETVIHSDPEILGGTPVFVGTRVPVRSLFDHLEAGDSIDDFLEGFPSVQRAQVIAVLEESRKGLLQPAITPGAIPEQHAWKLVAGVGMRGCDGPLAGGQPP